MKFYPLILSLVFFIQTSASENRSVPALERLVYLNCSNEKISTILDLVSKQTGVVFSYSQGTFVNESVTISIQQKSVRYVLNHFFADKVSYNVKGKYIILRKQEVQQTVKVTKKTKVIEGYITEPNTGLIISDATVYDETLMASAITDKYGYFRIELPENKDSIKLHIRKQGYNEIVLKPNDNWQFLNIPLDKKINTLVTVFDSASSKIGKNIQYDIPKWLVTNRLVANTKNIPDTFWRKTQFSVLPYIGTNKLFTGNFANDYSFNLLAGYVYEVRKIEIGGWVNIVRTNASHIQVAGIGNIVGGKSNGMQYAGTFNYARDLNGVQIAGTFNVIRNNTVGLQAAGISNFTLNKIKGFQTAGIINIAGEIDGIQAAGIVNIAYKKATGIFIAGITNYSYDSLQGTQIAGIINKSNNQQGSQIAGINNQTNTINKGIQLAGIANNADTIRGTQIASVYNRANYVEGIQLGFVNFADSCNGVPIGFFSFVKKGYHKIELGTDELRFANLAFRTGTKWLHNNFIVSIRPEKLDKDPIWCFGLGLGTTFPLNKKNNFDIDISSLNLRSGDYASSTSNLYKLEIGIDRQLAPKLSLAYGLSCNAYLTDRKANANDNGISSIIPYSITDININSNKHIKAWVGGKITLRFL